MREANCYSELENPRKHENSYGELEKLVHALRFAVRSREELRTPIASCQKLMREANCYSELENPRKHEPIAIFQCDQKRFSHL